MSVAEQEDLEKRIHTTGGDGRRLIGRFWDAGPQADMILVIHGVTGHSGWFHLWAEELLEHGVSLLAPDRRGSGLDTEARGDAASADVLLDDLDRWADFARENARRIHLCGFCWGSNYAVHYLSQRRRDFASLVLVVPGIFPTTQVLARPQQTGTSSEATVEAPVGVEEFTRGPLLESYLRPDPLRLDRVSPRFVAIEKKMAAMLPIRLAKIKLPILLVLADHDEISDSSKTRELFERYLHQRGRCVHVPGAHGVVFEAPADLARHCAAWIST